MYTKNEEELQSLGERLGYLLEKNDVLILTGELGAGKTTFTKGLAKGLQISQMIKSPTYTIVREYEGRLPLYHLDVYRIEGDADSIDLDEFLFGGGVTVIEWGHLLGDALPDTYLELEILNEEELQALGERLGHLLEKNDVLILTGELGAGKTTFTKGLAKGLQITQMIKSPTYTIVREYEGRLPLYHLDVYRIEGDADSIDLDEFLFGGGVTVIEWGHLLGDALPNTYLELEILKEADGRRLNFQAKGLRAEKLLEELQHGV